MDKKDKELLSLLQSGFPLCQRPYLQLAEKLNLSETEVMSRIQALKETGVIRRIAAFGNPRRLGYVSSLCAAQVDEPFLDQAAAIINSYREITHNYVRDDLWNVWFTVIAANQERLQEIVREISQSEFISRVISLPANSIFKVNVRFKL